MSKVHGVGSISGKMLIDLNRRFHFVTDPAAPNFDPVYVALLSPPYRKLLNSAQEVKAKCFLLE